MMNYDSLFTNSEDTLQKIEKMAVLKDGEGKFFFPVTCTAGIYDMEGNTLADRLKRLHNLASERQIVILEDNTYDKTSLLSYLKSILSDPNLTGDSLAYVRLSNSKTILFNEIQNADLIVLKFHDILFVWLIDISNHKRYHANVDKASITLGWQEELTYPVDLEEEKKYITKEYVDKQLESLTNVINNDIKTQIDSMSTELSKIRIDMLQEIDKIIKAQNELNKNTYVSQTYFNTEFEKIKEELNNSIDVVRLEQSVGDVNNLKTNDKTSLVNAINEVFHSGNNFKEILRDTIIAKDETVIIPENPNLDDLTNSIKQLKPSTYADEATAIAEDIITGKSAYTGEGLVEGAMPINELSGTTITPGTQNIIIPKGYNSDDITVAGDPDLIAANILQGKDIFGVLGAASSGMKFASGYLNVTTFVPTRKYNNGEVIDTRISTNLSFTPKYVFAIINNINAQSGTSSSWTGGGGITILINNISTSKISRITSSSEYGITLQIINISSSGFTIRATANGSSYFYAGGALMNTWYAFG